MEITGSGNVGGSRSFVGGIASGGERSPHDELHRVLAILIMESGHGLGVTMSHTELSDHK